MMRAATCMLKSLYMLSVKNESDFHSSTSDEEELEED